MSLLTQASLVLTPTSYKANKLYSVVPSSGNGDLTTTRATTATRVNSNGLVESVATGIPRVDYTDGVANILLEPQRTNLSLYSENYENIYFSKTNALISSNAINSPNNTLSADKLYENTSTGAHGGDVCRVNSISTIANYTTSFYIKKGEKTSFQLWTRGASSNNRCVWNVDLNLKTLTFVSNLGNFVRVSESIKELPNDWFLITTTITPFTGETNLSSVVWFNATVSYTGDGVSGLYIWGGQIELGSYATSYIPTTTSTVTRNLDLASVSGVTSLIGQTEGVIFVETAALANDLTQRIIGISDITSNNRLGIYYSSTSNQILCYGVTNGTNFTSAIAYTLTDETQFAKIAIRYRVNDFTLWVNGVKRGTDLTSQALPLSFSRFGFDGFSSGNGNFYGKVKSAQLYKTYLTDAEMASLTTL